MTNKNQAVVLGALSAALSLGSFAAAASINADSVPFGRHDMIHQAPYPYPNPYKHPDPCKGKYWRSDCGGKDPWIQGEEKHPMVKALGDEAAAVGKTIGEHDFSKASEGLDGIFEGRGLSGGNAFSGPAVPVGSYSVAKPSPLDWIKPKPPSRDWNHRSIVPEPAQTASKKFQFYGAAEDALKIAIGVTVNQVIKRVSEAVNDHVNRDQTKESIAKYGGCRMNNTCGK